MTTYFFLQTDYDDLLAEIDQLKSQISAIKAQVGASTSQSSETWHDNIDHEELMRKHDLYTAHLRDKKLFKNQAAVVRPDRSSKIVQIGSYIEYEDETGKTYTIKIGSYRQIRDLPNTISYEAPLARALLGKKLGANASFTIASRTKNITISKITN